MASMTDALQAFLEHKSRKVGNVQSTGETLLSYGWWELARWHNGSILVRTGPSYSQSTACQRSRLGLYRWQASPVETPAYQSYMNCPSISTRDETEAS